MFVADSIVAVCGSGATGTSAVTDFLGGYKSCMLIPQEPSFFRETEGGYSIYKLIKDNMFLRCIMFNNSRLSYNERLSEILERLVPRVNDALLKVECVRKFHYSKVYKFEKDPSTLQNGLLNVYLKFLNSLVEDHVFMEHDGFISVSGKILPALLRKQTFIKFWKGFMDSYFLEWSSYLGIEEPSKVIILNEFYYCDQNSVKDYSLLYKNLQIVWLIRDPRDSFFSWRKHNWISEKKVDDFIAFYRSLNNPVKEIPNQLLVVRFEDFILEHERTAQKILDFLKIPNATKINGNCVYQNVDSLKNIGQYKTYPNQDVMNYIATELKEYLYE